MSTKMIRREFHCIINREKGSVEGNDCIDVWIVERFVSNRVSVHE